LSGDALGSLSTLIWKGGFQAGAVVFYHKFGIFLTFSDLPLVVVWTGLGNWWSPNFVWVKHQFLIFITFDYFQHILSLIKLLLLQ
jgi:hypothetical protein